jgi:hypothetical protein
MGTALGDAKSIWNGRDAKEREQEALLVELVKRHNATARETKMSGDLVLRIKYKDGGVVKPTKVEVHVEER